MDKPQTLKGFRDFLPEKMAIRNRVISTFRRVFESYGFLELQTPTLEYAEVLKGKYGEEAEKLMYLFQDPGDREVGLKYDLTVPLARVMAQYQDLPKPFKRYQIQPVFRAENTQKGRYREFYQCDVDTVGTSSLYADAEILAVISDSLKALGFTNFKVRLNSRKVLSSLMQQCKVPSEKNLSTLQCIDKLDKKSELEVRQELQARGVNPDQVDELFACINTAQADDDLKQVMDMARKLGVENIEFDPTLVRGLDYYTGSIFETVVTEPKIGSITGGGRYDSLIKTLGGPDLPAVGSTLGLDRICDVIEELQLGISSNIIPQILVTNFSPNLLDKSIELSNNLRRAGVSTELYPEDRIKLEKQLKYASQKGIPYVAIIGPEETSKSVITLKNMLTGSQKTITLEECLAELARSSS